MSRLKNAFQNKKAFIGFLTGGDPSLDKSREYILEMERAGAAVVEIGVPFSDPIAEGEVIQEANVRALKNGVTVDGIFALVRRVRETSQIPLVLLTYLNPVYHYGYERFFNECRDSGADGVIIPDLPFEEKGEVVKAKNPDVDLISLVSPESKERVKLIAKEAEGFLYIVSSMGVTGVREEITTDIAEIAALAKQAGDVPCAVGFGISTPKQAAEIAKSVDGVIVGSAIVRIIEKYGDDAGEKVYAFVKEIADAI